jgi:hypothetical protein
MNKTVMVHTPTGKIVSVDAADFRAILCRANDWYSEHSDVVSREAGRRMRSLIVNIHKSTLNLKE